MGNTAENTPLDSMQDDDAGEGDVNWDAAKEFFTSGGQKNAATRTPDAGEQTDTGEEDDVEYVDENGNVLSPEEVAAIKAEGVGIGEEGEETPAGEPEFVQVRIKGRTLTLPREDAEAFEEYRREARERDGRLGGELQQYRERLAALEAVQKDRQMLAQAGKQTQEVPQKPPWKLAIENFEEYERQYDAYVDHKIASARRELVEAYNEEQRSIREATIKEQTNRAWVGGFYSENSHLDKPLLRPIVAQVFTENQRELEGYGDDVVSAYSRLAELAESRIVELTSTGRSLRKPPAVEGAQSAPRRVVVKSPRDENFSTADWVTRERAKMFGQEGQQ